MRLFSKIYIVPKLNAKDAPIVKQVTSIICKAATCSEPYIQVLAPVDINQIDSETLIIAVGGDGTMLEAMRLAAVHDAIATGINLGQVGFLTDFVFDRGDGTDNIVAPNNLNLFNELIVMFHKANTYPIEKRMAVKVLASKEHELIGDTPVFNEFVFSNLYSDSIIKYHLRINQFDAGYHKANGVIVGTPTGSTAYTLSNGGGLILPSLNVMQIVPVAPMSMSSRPIIVPGDAVVSITVETEGKWVLKGDGNVIREFEGKGPTIDLCEYHRDTRILHTKSWNFFTVLTEKLHWKHL
jgi:NAD+ kinase